MKASADLIQPSRKEFVALAKEHTLVPVYRTLTADLETPVSAFLRAAWQERECFLLESVEGGEQVGRYTFIGLNPYKRIVARGRANSNHRRQTDRRGSKAIFSTFCATRWAGTSRRDCRACLPSPPARWAFLPTTRCARSSGCRSWRRMNSAFPTLACCSLTRCWPSTTCARRSGWW